MRRGDAVIGVPRSGPDRVERVRAWVERFTTALETGDAPTLERAFAVECGYRPAPFHAELRGRGPIVRALLERAGRRPGLAIAAEVLGAGGTFAVVHWRLTWPEEVPAEDGILLVALDVTGRCNGLREWAAADPGPAAGDAPVTGDAPVAGHVPEAGEDRPHPG